MKLKLPILIVLLIPSLVFGQEFYEDRSSWPECEYGCITDNFGNTVPMWQEARMNPYVLGAVTAVAGCTDANPVGDCTGLVLCSNFENTVEACTTCADDNSGNWVETLGVGGIIDEDDATSPAPLRGSQSMKVSKTDTGNPQVNSPSFTANAITSLFLRVAFSDATPASSLSFAHLKNVDTTSKVQLRLTAAAALLIISTTNCTLSSSIADNTVYNIWVDVNTDTDVVNGYLSTTRTKPGTPTCTATYTGSGTITYFNAYVDVTDTVWYDQILVKTGSVIGNVCD